MKKFLYILMWFGIVATAILIAVTFMLVMNQNEVHQKQNDQVEQLRLETEAGLKAIDRRND